MIRFQTPCSNHQVPQPLALRRKYRPCSDVLRHLKVLNEGRHACAYLHGRNALLGVSQDANIPTCTPFISLTLEFFGIW